MSNPEQPALLAAREAGRCNSEAQRCLWRVLVFADEYERVRGNPEDRRAMFYAAEYHTARAQEHAHAAAAAAKPYARMCQVGEGRPFVRPVWLNADRAARNAAQAAERLGELR